MATSAPGSAERGASSTPAQLHAPDAEPHAPTPAPDPGPGPGPGASSGAGQQALLVADLKLLLIEQVAEAGEEERLVVVFGAQQIGELSAEVGGGGLGNAQCGAVCGLRAISWWSR